MSIYDSPFYILGVSLRDNKQAIINAAENKILSSNKEPAIIDEAKNALINPKKRIIAELTWFPGLSPRMTSNVMSMLSMNAENIFDLVSMARALTIPFDPFNMQDESWNQYSCDENEKPEWEDDETYDEYSARLCNWQNKIILPVAKSKIFAFITDLYPFGENVIRSTSQIVNDVDTYFANTFKLSIPEIEQNEGEVDVDYELRCRKIWRFNWQQSVIKALQYFNNIDYTSSFEILAGVKRKIDITNSPVYNFMTMSSIPWMNLISTVLIARTDLTKIEKSALITYLSELYELINVNELYFNINESRNISGFPLLHSEDFTIEECLNILKKGYKDAIESAINTLPSQDLVKTVTTLITKATENGARQAPIMLYDMIDSYEINSQSFLNKESGNIKTVAEKIKNSVATNQPEPVIDSLVDTLIKVTKNWDKVAQPIQLSKQSKGQDDELGIELGNYIRDVAVVDLYNNGWHKQGEKVLHMVGEVFAEVARVADKNNEDLDTLEKIKADRRALEAKQKQEDAEWAREITYSAEWGLIVKNHVRISPSGVEWKNEVMRLEEISSLCWGGFIQKVNGITTSKVYTAVLNSSYRSMTIKITKEDIFDKFVDCLWKAVGIRLLFEFLQLLKNKESVAIGNILVFDTGVKLTNFHLFKANDVNFYPWSDIRCYCESGNFYIKSISTGVTGSASYLSAPNTHVFETALRIFFKKGGTNISSALD